MREGAVDIARRLLIERGDVAAAWVFGSRVRDLAPPESDLDLALLFQQRPTADALADLRSALEERVGGDVDVLDLERSSPVIAMQALRTGRLILDADPAHRHRFATSLPARYEDVSILRRSNLAPVLDRMRHGRS